jgi:hypothetical protein
MQVERERVIALPLAFWAHQTTTGPDCGIVRPQELHWKGKSMRGVIIPAIIAVFVSGAAYAQAWEIYTNRDNFFTLNLPGAPKETSAPYKTEKGTNLTMKTWTAAAPSGSLLAGSYMLHVIDYSSATGELATAIEEAAKKYRARGATKYEGVNMLDNHRSWRQTVENANERILTEILIAKNNRLYVSEAITAINAPVPAQFQASLQILDENGVRIRYARVESNIPGEIVPVTPANTARVSGEIAGQVAGVWRNPQGGSCQTAYFRSGERTTSSRGEQAMNGTVVNAGTTISGQLLIAGPRVGQFINPNTDRAIFLFDALPGNKLLFSPIGEPAAGWPEVTLEKCAG